MACHIDSAGKEKRGREIAKLKMESNMNTITRSGRRNMVARMIGSVKLKMKQTKTKVNMIVGIFVLDRCNVS